MFNKVVTILFFSIVICSSLSAASNESRVCIGDNVNFRSSADKGNNVIGQCTICDILDITEIPKYNQNMEKPNDYWVKCIFKGKAGYINAAFLSQKYAVSNNILIWSTLQSIDGAVNPYEIVVFNLKTKSKLLSNTFEFSKISFSGDGKYFAADSGSSIVRSLKFYESISLKEIFSTSYYDSKFEWNDNIFIFKKVFTKDNINYTYEEVFFKDGKIDSTGKKGTFKDN